MYPKDIGINAHQKPYLLYYRVFGVHKYLFLSGTSRKIATILDIGWQKSYI